MYLNHWLSAQYDDIALDNQNEQTTILGNRCINIVMLSHTYMIVPYVKKQDK